MENKVSQNQEITVSELEAIAIFDEDSNIVPKDKNESQNGILQKRQEKENIVIQYENSEELIEDQIFESHAGAIIQNRKMPAFKGANSKFAKYGKFGGNDENKKHQEIQVEI